MPQCYRDVAEQVRAHDTEKARKVEALKKSISDHHKRHNSLYLMQHTNGLTKIGMAKNPRVREKTLQAEDPRLCIVFEAAGKGHLEKNLHSHFSEYRIRGEWFNLSAEQIEWIKCWVNSN